MGQQSSQTYGMEWMSQQAKEGERETEKIKYKVLENIKTMAGNMMFARNIRHNAFNIKG